METTSIKKEPKHSLLNSVAFTSLAVPAIFFLVRDVIAVLLGLIVEMTAGKSSFLYEISDDIARIAIAVILILIMPLYFRGKCNFGLKGGCLKLGICLALPEIIVPVWNLLQIYVYKAPFVSGISAAAAAVFHGFGPGFSEEVFCRGFVVSNLMRIEKDKPNRALRCILLSGVSFGLLHLVNVIATGDITSALVQVIYAAAIGIFSAAVYIRSRNLWGVILLHTLTDISAFIAVFDTNASGMDIAFSVFGLVLFVALAFYMIRPAKQDEINALWADGWSFGEETEKTRNGAKAAAIITAVIALLIVGGIGVACYQAKMGYDTPLFPSDEKELDANIAYDIGNDGRELTISFPCGTGETYEVQNSAPDRLTLKESGKTGDTYRFVFSCEGNSSEKIDMDFTMKLDGTAFSMKSYSVSVIFDESGKISEIKG